MNVQFHSLQSYTKRKRARRVGRGGKRGTTAGRGTKGQKSRAGHKIRPEIRDVMKRIPKLRGYKFHSFAVKPVAVALSALEKSFLDGDKVTLASLARKGLIKNRFGGRQPAKILGKGPIGKRLSVVGVATSRAARAAIEAAGGAVG